VLAGLWIAYWVVTVGTVLMVITLAWKRPAEG